MTTESLIKHTAALIAKLRDLEPLATQLGIHAKQKRVELDDVDRAVVQATEELSSLVDLVDRTNLRLQRRPVSLHEAICER